MKIIDKITNMQLSTIEGDNAEVIITLPKIFDTEYIINEATKCNLKVLHFKNSDYKEFSYDYKIEVSKNQIQNLFYWGVALREVTTRLF